MGAVLKEVKQTAISCSYADEVAARIKAGTQATTAISRKILCSSALPWSLKWSCIKFCVLSRLLYLVHLWDHFGPRHIALLEAV